jgi:hypothetical protein
MYVRTREESSGHIRSPYIRSASPLGSYIGDLAEPQTLAERLRALHAGGETQKIFDILRKQPQFPLDPAIKTELRRIFGPASDELWLSERLADHGPEPLWPLPDIKGRVGHTQGLASDPGNYGATLPDPSPGGTLTGKLAKCRDKLQTPELPRAFFFPGRSDRRALIIGGVHGDEKRGVKVVQRLQSLLAARSATGNKPFFTTVLVPIVIPRTQAKGDRNVPGGIGMNNSGTEVCRSVEPNRNFPLPGENFAAARQRGNSGATKPELMIRDASNNLRPPKGNDTSSIRMLPETRALISLIERFQPERLASVHDHSLKQSCHACNGKATRCGGEGPGIFVDPRGIDPQSGQITNKAQFDEDDKLATRMLHAALGRLPCSISLLNSAFPPFAGNQAFFPPTVRYFSQQRVEGNSLGDWAPVPTTGRQGIATLTIEVPKYPSSHAAAEKRVIDLHRDLLQEIFLESP